MNVVSLFSGIGGLDEGLRRAGFRTVVCAEKLDWRRRILRRHFPEVEILADVREVPEGSLVLRPGTMGGDAARANAGRGGPDSEDGYADYLLAGGFPCQDVSVAGLRAGLAGSESGLFFEFVRIAEALRPRWLLVENVPGLLTSNGGRDFGAVLGSLADLGYGLAWRILDSRYFGVPQRRRRLFVLGAAASGDPRRAAERAGEILAVGARCDRHPPPGVEEEEEDRSGTGEGAAIAGPLGSLTGGFRTTDLDGQGAMVAARESSVRRLMPVECERLQAFPDGWTEGGSDTKRYAALGDAVTVSVAEWIGRRIIEREESEC